MKIYTYHTGEKAVFVNNVKTVISDKQAQMIELFTSKINSLCPNHKEMVWETDETILNETKKYDIHTVSGEVNSMKVEVVFLTQDGKEIDYRFFQDGKDITFKLRGMSVEKAVEQAQLHGLK